MTIKFMTKYAEGTGSKAPVASPLSYRKSAALFVSFIARSRTQSERITSFSIRSHAELLETDEKGRNDVVTEISEIAVLRGLGDAVVVHRPRAPDAAPVAESGVLTAGIVTNRTLGCAPKKRQE